MTVVRRYDHDTDFDAIAVLGRAHVDETSPHLDFDLELLRERLGVMALQEDRSVLVAFVDGVMSGYAISSIEPWLPSRARYSTLDLVFVAPEYRGGRSLLELTFAFLKWSKDVGAATSFAGVNHGKESVEPIIDLYRRMGFQPCGAILWRDCHAVA